MIREANLFDIIPSGFFNCLSSGSNNRIYADCLLVIYEQYDREITYRISRGRIRDALSAYLLENHINFLELDSEQAGEKLQRYCQQRDPQILLQRYRMVRRR